MSHIRHQSLISSRPRATSVPTSSTIPIIRQHSLPGRRISDRSHVAGYITPHHLSAQPPYRATPSQHRSPITRRLIPSYTKAYLDRGEIRAHHCLNAGQPPGDRRNRDPRTVPSQAIATRRSRCDHRYRRRSDARCLPGQRAGGSPSPLPDR